VKSFTWCKHLKPISCTKRNETKQNESFRVFLFNYSRSSSSGPTGQIYPGGGESRKGQAGRADGESAGKAHPPAPSPTGNSTPAFGHKAADGGTGRSTSAFGHGRSTPAFGHLASYGSRSLKDEVFRATGTQDASTRRRRSPADWL
jgi:hypothetical protein